MLAAVGIDIGIAGDLFCYLTTVDAELAPTKYPASCGGCA
jgi:hypothetical protein